MGTTHHPDGTLQENLHGWFGGGLEPVVRVEPGDSVAYRTAAAMWDRSEDPNPATGEVPRPARPEGARHTLAGPVWVEGAQPGNVLVVHVREILTRNRRIEGHVPGKRTINGVLGGEPDDVRDEYLVRFPLNRGRGVWRFGERVEVPLAPFVGVPGVAPGFPEPTSTLRPEPHSGNKNCKELRAAPPSSSRYASPGPYSRWATDRAPRETGKSTAPRSRRAWNACCSSSGYVRGRRPSAAHAPKRRRA